MTSDFSADSRRAARLGRGGWILRAVRGRFPSLGGFTLLELLVAMAVLAIVLVLILSLTENVFRMWRNTKGAIEEWQSARLGFQTLSRRLSLATLNTTWAYYDAAGALTTSDPKSYGRYSGLQFVVGPAATLLPDAPNVVAQSQAVFFQAPLGLARNNALKGMPNLLNACGFFVQFNNDADFRPSTGLFAGMDGRWRFRLMALAQPSEDFQVYQTSLEQDYSWFQNAVSSGEARPLADNVIALIIQPAFSRLDTSNGTVLAPEYYYNSRRKFAFSSSGVSGNTFHQLPPLLRITMVAIDETSALRLQEKFGEGSMPDLFEGAPFSTASEYEHDLKQLEENLVDLGVKYRVFSSVIFIRAAKWSGDQL